MSAEAETPRQEWPHWPLWAPIAGALFGVSVAILVMGVVAGVLRSGGVHITDSSPGFTAAFTVVQDVCVVIASIGVAATTIRPRAWQFGLRPAPLRFTTGIVFMGLAAFYLFALVYSAIVQPHNPQKIVQNLGADKSTLLLVVGALVVIAVAPVCEELFFRGFMFRVLRLRTGFWAAAAVDGILFGLVHGVNVVLPVLVVLGVVLCWVFERTGTLFATIAIHAFNNMVSYGASTDNGWVAALPIGAVVLTGCVVVPRLMSTRARPPAHV